MKDLTWRVSVKGSTEYALVLAPSKEVALGVGAVRLGLEVNRLEVDLETRERLPE